MSAERISVGGDLDIATIDALSDQISSTTAALVEVDTSGLNFVDSTGLRALLTARAELAADGRRLVVVDPSRAVIRLLEIAGATDLLE